ncbi:MAG: FtsQ-type POTRA domain-containing protein [Actinomycetota bacterium]
MTTVVVDPRLRARRIEVLREQGRRRLRWVIAVGIVLGAAAIVLVALRTPLFDIDDVRVVGAERTSTRAVLAAADVSTGAPLVELDTGAVASDVETLPWISEVHVSKDWPGGVVIEVIERTPAAVVDVAGDLLLVDQSGWVLAETTRRPADLAVVELAGDVDDLVAGDQLDPEERSALVLASRASEALRLAPGTVRTDDGDLLWEVEGVGRFRFGTLAELDAKFVAAAAVLERLGGTVDGELDLREPSAVVRRVDAPVVIATEGEPGSVG